MHSKHSLVSGKGEEMGGRERNKGSMSPFLDVEAEGLGPAKATEDLFSPLPLKNKNTLYNSMKNMVSVCMTEVLIS